jgi:hypothetical protein
MLSYPAEYRESAPAIPAFCRGGGGFINIRAHKGKTSGRIERLGTTRRPLTSVPLIGTGLSSWADRISVYRIRGSL